MNSGTKTEVIDLEDSNVVCEDLEDFPVDTYGAVGGNLASIPIICGGVVTKNSDHTSDKCLKYTIQGAEVISRILRQVILTSSCPALILQAPNSS